MSSDTNCQNCGNAGRFTVVVTNDRVNGQWCRNACSRMCAEILSSHGIRELERTGGYGGRVHVETRPQLTGINPQCVVR